MKKILETTRLTLRIFTLADAAFINELVNDPSYIENIGDKGVRNLEGAKKFIQNNIIPSYEKNGYGAYLVKLKETNESIGLSGFFKREQFESPDIGYAFLPKFTGKGYAEEASRAVLEYGKNQLKFETILAFTSQKNEPSSKLLEKIGLHFEKLIEYADEEDKVRLYST